MEIRGIIMQINEVVRSNNLKFDELSSEQLKKVYAKALKIFSDMPDRRNQNKIVYSMNQIFLMMFLATLCGSDACTEYAAFWNSRPKLYKKIFGIDVIPSHDTFRRILGLIDSTHLNELIVEAIESADTVLRKVMKVPAPKMRHLSVDGKEETGTGRENSITGKQRNRQILNFFDNDNETCIYSESIEEKTNEIPHAQNILAMMDLTNTIVSADALHTQIETVRIITSRGGEYLLGLKGNQHTLYDTAESIFNEERLKNLHNTNSYYYTKEIARNQLEEREFYIYLLTPSLKKTVFEKWEKANAVVCYKKHTVNNLTGKETTEVRYYLTSLKEVTFSARIIRNHWGVENKLHWNLDTVLNEDMMTMTDKTAVRNRSIINKMCLSLYARIQEMDGKNKLSKKCLRKCFGWAFEDMMYKALVMLDSKTLAKCLTLTPKVVSEAKK